MAFRLIPRQEKFFDDFQALAAEIQVGARLLEEMLAPDPPLWDKADEIKEVDDIGGLLSRNCAIRYIITKQALQEGWDCPFAYVLAVLTNPSSKTALTQLVGRILRQPDGRKTGNHWLDESYVFCFQRKGAALLQDIRNGFGQEGLGDLKGRIIDETGRVDRGGAMEIFPRERFKGQAEHLVLPAGSSKAN